MEPIKFEVNIELNFSDDAKTFVKELVTSLLFSANSKSVAEKPVAEKPVAEKPVAEKPQETKPKADEPQVSIEDVRKVLATKVAEHRSEIKEKLEELGAPSVTRLDPAKYQEMLNFLNEL